MELIKPSDPQYFSKSSEEPYVRHNYKIVSKTGDSSIVDNWEDAHRLWFQKSSFLSHIEVLDKKKESNSMGFK
jgi:hypothetical protein